MLPISTTTLPPDPTTSFLGQPYSFQGREWDPALGLFYFRARYYDPALGRFISQDPERYSDSPNLYQSFLNSPLNLADRLGLKVGSVSGCDTNDSQKFYKCAVKQIGEEEALEMYDLLFNNRAQQLAPAIIQAGQAIEETMKIQAVIIAAGVTGGTAGTWLGTETLASRLASCGIGGAGGQAMADFLNGKISDSGQYSEATLDSMAMCIGIEGGIWGLKQMGFLKSSAGVIKYPESTQTSNEKGELAKEWSREAALARGETIIGEEMDLIFTIDGKKVTVRGDVVTTSDGELYTYIESKYSPDAPFTPNQKIVVPRLIQAGDAGLMAEVGARAGTLRRGRIIRVVFQGDVWERAPALFDVK